MLIFTAGSRRKKSKASVPAAFSLKSELAQQIKATLKLTDKQIQRCYEVFRLAELDREVRNLIWLYFSMRSENRWNLQFTDLL